MQNKSLTKLFNLVSDNDIILAFVGTDYNPAKEDLRKIVNDSVRKRFIGENISATLSKVLIELGLARWSHGGTYQPSLTPKGRAYFRTSIIDATITWPDWN
jgi:hypothetical protein